MEEEEEEEEEKKKKVVTMMIDGDGDGDGNEAENANRAWWVWKVREGGKWAGGWVWGKRDDEARDCGFVLALFLSLTWGGSRSPS